MTITVNGEPHTNGTAAEWEIGANAVVIKAQNDTGTRAYTVTVTKSEV